MSEVVHIAGIDVTVGHQFRQRCAWCGAVLIDYDLTRVMVPVGQEHGGPTAWPVGELLSVDTCVSFVVDHQADRPLPANACAQLPHDVTGHVAPAG